MELMIQVFVSGLLLGGIYAIISIGLNLIFGIVRIINFAHGEMVMIAMYLTYWCNVLYGIDPYVSILIVVPIMFFIGVIIQRIVIQPILEASSIMRIFTTVALSLILQNIALIIWKGDFRSVQTSYSMSTVQYYDIIFSVPRLISFIVALIFLVILYYFLKYTFVGKAMRAIVEDYSVSRLMGVGVEKMYIFAFGLGSAFCGLAGALLMPFSSVYPTVGLHYTLVAFVVVVLGGLGNMGGTLLAALFIGIVESFSGTYLAPALKETVYFCIFIAVLLVRPQGLFGKGKGTEEVGLK
ncbi:MAG: branched-chain amino acid ABC transporter permease [Desulfohalobiaceae bacterium]|nr:branched-chain amino acid ABC transporter permease [Desulfohalobiaceae bacterium]